MTDFYLLSIDTTGKKWSVSVFSDDRELSSYLFDEKTVVSSNLAPSIVKILSEFEVKPSRLSAIAVAAGPGSMTGIRIGMSTAVGLASSLGIPCAGVNLLKAMHEVLGSADHDTVAVCSAGRNMLNWQLFNAAGQAPGVRNGSPQEFREFVLTLRSAQIIATPDIEDQAFDLKSICPAALSSVVGRWAVANRSRLSEFPAAPVYASELTFKKLSEQ